MKLDKIEVVTDFKHFELQEIKDTGEYHRRVVYNNEVLAEDEHQEVKDKAEELWTDEVKTAWTTYRTEREAALRSSS